MIRSGQVWRWCPFMYSRDIFTWQCQGDGSGIILEGRILIQIKNFLKGRIRIKIRNKSQNCASFLIWLVQSISESVIVNNLLSLASLIRDESHVRYIIDPLIKNPW